MTTIDELWDNLESKHVLIADELNVSTIMRSNPGATILMNDLNILSEIGYQITMKVKHVNDIFNNIHMDLSSQLMTGIHNPDKDPYKEHE